MYCPMCGQRYHHYANCPNNGIEPQYWLEPSPELLIVLVVTGQAEAVPQDAVDDIFYDFMVKEEIRSVIEEAELCANYYVF